MTACRETKKSGQPCGAAAGADACALLPAEEVGTALGVSGVKATPMPGSDVSYCNYDSADGKSVAATSYSTNASAVYPTFASAEGAIPIPGVADGAVISGGVVYVLKGNSMFGFQPGSGANITPDKLAAIAKTIASSAAGRM